ncbi:hypothetical protein [Corynebacterium vitaeruminis]|uniref:hypothetical protein n=1 Tax=Corynebacterium vitaeruminis TaxID=38305 RepID=UPI000660151E|nr:hypothetical protein [Corynebacterium vitaeruminis]
MSEVAPKPGQGQGAGPVPGPKPGFASATKPGPSAAPSPAAMPGAREVTPEDVRDQVAAALSAPAPTPQERVAQFERAHEILYEALGSSRREGK